MMVSGSATLNAAPDAVWKALNDPAVLVRTIPGCVRLEAVGPDAYAMTITAGVASIKGVYTGQVRLTDQNPPDTFVLKASGAGGPGTVSADVQVRLAGADGGRTTLTYDADAVVGGMIGGVGQRMLSGVAKKTAGEFFAAVDDVINGRAATAAPVVASGAAPSDGAPTLFETPGAAEALNTGGGFLQGALVGAAAALLGAVVGGWLTGRRRRG
jgi:carbon monoxide dehydrogenase subunit G